MPQSLLIFRKDLRHLWPETLVTLLLFAAFAWAAPSGWNASPYAGVITLLAILIKILMPVAWLVMISRLVHDESLVGDRQFWTSRPYHWAKLLAAKLLYLVVFLYLPLLLMQVYLLKHAGLYPTTAIPALLHNLLLLTVIVVVPLTAIASVTGTFARMLVSTIGAILYLVVILLLLAWFLWQRLEPTTLEPFLYVILIALPAAILVYQYATRKTALSRILLAATPLIAFVILISTPATALIRHAYPVASASSDPRISAIPDELLPKEAPKGQLQIFQNKVNVGFPFSIAGIGQDFDYVLEGVAVTIDAPGVHWQSPYVAANNEDMNANSTLKIAAVPMPLDLFNRIHNTPVAVHLSLAASKLKAESPSTWKATLQPFSVPGHGLCTYSDYPNPPVCRYPFKLPELNYVTAPVSSGSCPDTSGASQLGRSALTARPSGIDFDPVVTVPLRLSTGNGDPRDPRSQATLCPGTSLTFIEAKPQGKYRFELDEKNVTLDFFAARIREIPQAQAQPQLEP